MKFLISTPRIVASAGAASLALALAGCNAVSTVAPAAPAAVSAGISGNWAMRAGNPQGLSVPAIAGSFTTKDRAISGVVHAPQTTSCLDSSTYLAVTGSADTVGKLTLTSASFHDSVLTVTGTASTDGTSLTGAQYTVTGGSCAFPVVAGSATVPMLATHYQAIGGTYTGTFLDAGGDPIAVSATLTQSTTPDGNGLYHLTGNASFPSNPCLTAPAVTDSTVTGNAVATTYSQTANGITSTVTANGTLSADALTLTVTGWTLTGGCGTGSGTGTLTKQ